MSFICMPKVFSSGQAQIQKTQPRFKVVNHLSGATRRLQEKARRPSGSMTARSSSGQLVRLAEQDITELALVIPEGAKVGDLLGFRSQNDPSVIVCYTEVPKWARPGDKLGVHSVGYFRNDRLGPVGIYDLRVLPPPPPKSLDVLLTGFANLKIECAPDGEPERVRSRACAHHRPPVLPRPRIRPAFANSPRSHHLATVVSTRASGACVLRASSGLLALASSGPARADPRAAIARRLAGAGKERPSMAGRPSSSSCLRLVLATTRTASCTGGICGTWSSATACLSRARMPRSHLERRARSSCALNPPSSPTPRFSSR